MMCAQGGVCEVIFLQPMHAELTHDVIKRDALVAARRARKSKNLWILFPRNSDNIKYFHDVGFSLPAFFPQLF